METRHGERVGNLKSGNTDPLHPYYSPIKAITEAVKLLEINYQEARNEKTNDKLHT